MSLVIFLFFFFGSNNLNYCLKNEVAKYENLLEDIKIAGIF